MSPTGAGTIVEAELAVSLIVDAERYGNTGAMEHVNKHLIAYWLANGEAKNESRATDNQL